MNFSYKIAKPAKNGEEIRKLVNDNRNLYIRMILSFTQSKLSCFTLISYSVKILRFYFHIIVNFLINRRLCFLGFSATLISCRWTSPFFWWSTNFGLIRLILDRRLQSTKLHEAIALLWGSLFIFRNLIVWSYNFRKLVKICLHLQWIAYEFYPIPWRGPWIRQFSSSTRLFQSLCRDVDSLN